MRKIMVYLVLFMVTLISVFSYSTSTSYACSCVPPGTPQEEMERSAAVFSGKVTKIVDENQNNFTQSSADSLAVQIEVKDAWKGIDQKQVVVYTARDSASCGFEFEVNQEYLIYASESEGKLQTTICSRTTLLNMAAEDMDALGEGEEITEHAGEAGEERYQSTAESENNSIKYTVTVVVGVVLIGGVYILYRKKKNH